MISLFEIYLELSGYPLKKSETELMRIQNMSLDDFKFWQNARKWVIARHHFDNNPMYRKKVGEQFPDDWEDLPIMEKSDFQSDIESLLSAGYDRKNTYIANTSGSSGHPFYFAKNKEAHAMDWALIKNRYSSHGLSLSSKQARFYGIPLDTLSHLKEMIKDLIMNRTRFPVFDLSDEKLEEYLSTFTSKRFEYIYGYTNSLLIFARYLLKQKKTLIGSCPTLRYCISTSEVLNEEDRDTLQAAFGVRVINEYGASEVGLLAFENPRNEWLICEETALIESLMPEGKQTDEVDGRIIVTDLDNMAMPFIRYDIGDMGVIGESSPSNMNYRTLNRLSGRQNDTIKLPSGKTAPGLTFYYVSRSILESSNILKEFIIRQTALDTFVFDVVSDRELTPDEISEMHKKMDAYLEKGLKLEIRRVNRIHRPSSGKIQHFYSELAT